MQKKKRRRNRATANRPIPDNVDAAPLAGTMEWRLLPFFGRVDSGSELQQSSDRVDARLLRAREDTRPKSGQQCPPCGRSQGDLASQGLFEIFCATLGHVRQRGQKPGSKQVAADAVVVGRSSFKSRLKVEARLSRHVQNSSSTAAGINGVRPTTDCTLITSLQAVESGAHQWNLFKDAVDADLFAGPMQKGALSVVPDVNRPANLQQLFDTSRVVVAHLNMHPAFQRPEL